MHPLRRLLVLGTNHLLLAGLIHKNPAVPIPKHAHDFMTLAGKSSVVNYCDIGYDEIRVSVWWDFDKGRHPQITGRYECETESFCCSRPLAKHSKMKDFVGVTVSGWIERRSTFCLQGVGNEALLDTYIRRGNRLLLDNIPNPKPMGFSVEGRVWM